MAPAAPACDASQELRHTIDQATYICDAFPDGSVVTTDTVTKLVKTVRNLRDVLLGLVAVVEQYDGVFPGCVPRLDQCVAFAESFQDPRSVWIRSGSRCAEDYRRELIVDIEKLVQFVFFFANRRALPNRHIAGPTHPVDTGDRTPEVPRPRPVPYHTGNLVQTAIDQLVRTRYAYKREQIAAIFQNRPPNVSAINHDQKQAWTSLCRSAGLEEEGSVPPLPGEDALQHPSRNYSNMVVNVSSLSMRNPIDQSGQRQNPQRPSDQQIYDGLHRIAYQTRPKPTIQHSGDYESSERASIATTNSTARGNSVDGSSSLPSANQTPVMSRNVPTPNTSTSITARKAISTESALALPLPALSYRATLIVGTAQQRVRDWQIREHDGGSIVSWLLDDTSSSIEDHVPSSDRLTCTLPSYKGPHMQVAFMSEHRVVKLLQNGAIEGDDDVQVKYTFPSVEDCRTFQSDLRDKDLLDVFPFAMISSKRSGTNGESTIQDLKLWQARNGLHFHSLSFFGTHDKKQQHLEFSLLDIMAKRTGTRATKTVRLYFDLHTPIPTAPKRKFSFAKPFASVASRTGLATSRPDCSRKASDANNVEASAYEQLQEKLQYLEIRFDKTHVYENFTARFKVAWEQDQRGSHSPSPTPPTPQRVNTPTGLGVRYPSWTPDSSPTISPRSAAPTSSLWVPPDESFYKIGIICALPIERAAVEAMLEQKYSSLSRTNGDGNKYTFGKFGRHNIAIASLPSGMTGTVTAATVARDMMRTFHHIKFGLLVGIGGGVRSGKDDIRLGDVVVSQPRGKHGGVVQWDFGKMESTGFVRTGSLDRPPEDLLQLLSTVQTRHEVEGIDLGKYLAEMMRNHPVMAEEYCHQGVEHDILFQAEYTHADGETCEACDSTKVIHRRPRKTNAPKAHYGTIASGDEVMKNGVKRDEIAAPDGVICFEMEAAGLMNTFPCLVIRGICDYCDSHKNDRWQRYAAATAAAYAKDLLSDLDPL